MERYIFTKYGGIAKCKGKIIKRQRKGGIVQKMFRTEIGYEYPLTKTAETLSPKQKRRYEIHKLELELEDLFFQKYKYPEDAENIDRFISIVNKKLKELKYNSTIL